MASDSSGARGDLDLDAQAELEAVAAVIGEENCGWQPRLGGRESGDVDVDEEDEENAEFRM